MGFDAMANGGSAPTTAVASGKKKRGNKKLKQCKLDARREQWLSQVKDNEAKKSANCCTQSPVLSPQNSHAPLPHPRSFKEEVEVDGIGQEMCDLDSPGNSPMSSCSMHHSSHKLGPTVNNGASSGSSIWSSSRSVSDAEDPVGGGDEENEDLDDWEAVADALSFEDNHDHQLVVSLAMPTDGPAASVEAVRVLDVQHVATQPEPIQRSRRAWSPDDAFRPQSLPSISKQVSFPARMEVCLGGSGREQNGVVSLQQSCPICFEDLDNTDSSFLPCPCGFCLCLFCHKRILEDDGRCPGCRKQYDTTPGGGGNTSGREAGVLAVRLSRSCSMGPKY